jgi:crotonobetainyl-CoA:carnitine CoA-transferase CaiB-like acyl-CoA transferase
VRWPRVELAHADARSVQVPGPGFGSSLPLVPDPLSAPPVRGEHSRAVLREAGLDDASIDAMIADGVVRQHGETRARAG